MARDKQALDTVVIGAGPAGLGTALALGAVRGLSYRVCERGAVGQTFADWPAGQRFLTPSFTGNGFGATDLNAIHPVTSPAYTLGADYPDGPGYAAYLRVVASHFKVPVVEQAGVTAVHAADGGFELDTSRGHIRARTLVWAGGEFHHPAMPPIEGGDLLDHSSSTAAWAPRDGAGSELVVIGGYESGMDLACHHVRQGISVVVADPGAPWDDGSKGADPSFLLAPRTRVRLRQALATGRLTLIAAEAVRVTDEQGRFVAPGQVAGDPLAAVTGTVGRLLGPAAAPIAGAGVVSVLVLGALAFITGSSRTVYQLAEDRHLPRLFAHVSRRGVPTGSVLLDAAVITAMLAVFGTNVVNAVAAANVGYLVVFILLPCAYLTLRRTPGRPDGGTRLGRWSVPLAITLAAFNLVLLAYGGSQWGWRVMTVGAGVSLAIVPAAAWSRHARRTP